MHPYENLMRDLESFHRKNALTCLITLNSECTFKDITDPLNHFWMPKLRIKDFKADLESDLLKSDLKTLIGD